MSATGFMTSRHDYAALVMRHIQFARIDLSLHRVLAQSVCVSDQHHLQATSRTQAHSLRPKHGSFVWCIGAGFFSGFDLSQSPAPIVELTLSLQGVGGSHG